MTSPSQDRLFGANSSMAVKVPCRVATTGPITLSGEQTIDGVAVVTGDRVLVKDQASGVDNGIYYADTSSWQRAPDFDGARDVCQGSIVAINQGTLNASTYWRVSTSGVITVGTTNIAFERALVNDADTVGFTQAGIGAIPRSSQEKMREIVSVNDFGAVGDGVTDDTAAILLARSYAATSGKTLHFPAGTYAYTGTETFEIDLGLFGVSGEGAVIDCTGFTGSYAVQVYSSLSYPGSYLNGARKVSGVLWVGGSDAGVHGMVVGNAAYASNDQLKIENGGAVLFDRNLSFIDNAWRIRFDHFIFHNALNYQIYLPSGLSNAGECLAFYHCEPRDGGAPILIALNDCEVEFHSSSVLNTPIIVSGVGARVQFFGGNLENPANATPYAYLTQSGADSIVALHGTGLVFNATATFTDSPFNVSAASATLVMNGVKLPNGSHLQFETTANVKAFVKGSGRVIADGVTCNLASPQAQPVLCVTPNDVYNGDAEINAITGWTATEYGSAGSTFAASATGKKNGTYGFILTTVATGGINVAQKKPCKPGQLVLVGMWAKLQTSGGAPCGYIQLAFRDADGNQISNPGEEITDTNWAWIGQSTSRVAPNGSASVEVLLNGQASAAPNVIYFDDITLNII